MEHFLLAEILMALVIAGIGYYLKTYLSEKGKNLATKEDIEAITDRIESVKKDYTTQLEQFKSELGYRWGSHSEYEKDRKLALLSFFESCTTLLEDKLRVNLGDLPSDNGKAMYEYQKEVERLFTSVHLDYLRLSLYFPNESELMPAAQMLVKYSYEARRHFNRNYGKLKLTALDEADAHLSGDKSLYRAAVERSNEAQRSYNSALSESISGMRKHFAEYLLALNLFLLSRGSRPTPDVTQP
jgi:hypothetical protein